MEIRGKPLEERGRRNVFCPHYRKCLDHAVSESWDVWSCGECGYLSDREPREDIFYGSEGTVAYYSLSQEVI